MNGHNVIFIPSFWKQENGKSFLREELPLDDTTRKTSSKLVFSRERISHLPPFFYSEQSIPFLEINEYQHMEILHTSLFDVLDHSQEIMTFLVQYPGERSDCLLFLMDYACKRAQFEKDLAVLYNHYNN